MMKFGVRAHDLGRKTPYDLAKNIANLGFETAQIALPKALSGIDDNTDILADDLPKTVKSAFDENKIEISVLGCYINIIHPDENIRNSLLKRFEEHIKFASKCGAVMVGTETGSVNADYSWNIENHSESAFLTAVKSIARLVKFGEQYGVNIGIEGVSSHSVHTPQKLRRLIDEIKSERLKIIFDPVNFLNNNNYENQNDIIKQSIQLFGDKILAVHAKDFLISKGKMEDAVIGHGNLNYKLIFELIKGRQYSLLFEGADVSTMRQSINKLKNTL